MNKQRLLLASPLPLPHLRRALCGVGLALVSSVTWGQSAAARPPGHDAALRTNMPASVAEALSKSGIPADAVSLWVQDVNQSQPNLAWRAEAPMNPASLMKLLTTQAALDLLGPAATWKTPVWVQGTPSASGVLDGNLTIRGSGDPKLVMERVWLLLRKVQQLGIKEIKGDIILDRSAFQVPERHPGEFDGESLRPYNVQADALMLNYKSVVFTFTPDPARQLAVVALDPPLAGVSATAAVPLQAGPCDDWRTGLKADFNDPTQLRFSGAYPVACGERSWPVAYAEPARFNERMLVGLWQNMGGKFTGRVRDGQAPATPPTFEVSSPPLAELIRDINKFSNNVMAQQLFLSLGLNQRGMGQSETSREVLLQWAKERFPGAAQALVVDNGSGLSRDNRVSAALLGQMLLSSWHSPVATELVSSLPISGTDGTLKRSQAPMGRAHLKTGSLKDVAGIAGVALHAQGQHVVVVALINHPQAAAGRPAMDALVKWATGFSTR